MFQFLTFTFYLFFEFAKFQMIVFKLSLLFIVFSFKNINLWKRSFMSSLIVDSYILGIVYCFNLFESLLILFHAWSVWITISYNYYIINFFNGWSILNILLFGFQIIKFVHYWFSVIHFSQNLLLNYHFCLSIIIFLLLILELFFLLSYILKEDFLHLDYLFY